MKRRIFGRIFLLYAITILASVVFIEFFITDAVRSSHIHDLRDHLLSQATLISNDISFKAQPPLDNICRQFKEQTGFRVTIIALDGLVLGDSDSDSSRMDNHAGRPEVQQSFMYGTGMSERHSKTLNEDLLYVAKKVTRDGLPIGIVRLSMQLTQVNASINSLRFKIIGVVIAILIATGLFSVGQLERIRSLTKQIGDFSRSLAGGAIGNKLYFDRAGEFEEIADKPEYNVGGTAEQYCRERRGKKEAECNSSKHPRCSYDTRIQWHYPACKLRLTAVFRRSPLEGKTGFRGHTKPIIPVTYGRGAQESYARCQRTAT